MSTPTTSIFSLEITFLGFAITLVAYQIGLWLKHKTKHPLANPLLIADIILFSLLWISRIPLDHYLNSAEKISFLLTPTTVCLAIPLYEQIKILKKHYQAILLGISSGVLAGLASIWVFSKLFRLEQNLYATLLPKSITTAIGIGLSEELGGVVSLTVACILITGIFGNVVASLFLKLFQITHPVAKGVALGTASHAIGTAKAMELGEIEGAMSSLAIVITGLLTVIGASIFLQLY